MDRWVGAISRPLESPARPKVIADKPSDISDQCSNGDGTVLTHSLCPANVVPVYGTPRTVAGEPITTDQNQCQLVPLSRSSYDVTFTDAQWAALQQVFSSGVCDYTKPGVYAAVHRAVAEVLRLAGHVVYGGTPMGSAPV